MSVVPVLGKTIARPSRSAAGALPELFAAAGARLPLNRETVADAARLVAEQSAYAPP